MVSPETYPPAPPAIRLAWAAAALPSAVRTASCAGWMRLRAGASRAVVPALPAPAPWPPALDAAALGAAPAAAAPSAAAPLAGAPSFAGIATELAAPLELPAEHPARNMPPPS